MDITAMIRRETAISAVINGALSALFFLAFFGLRGTVALDRFGTDFLPQSFMIALMGSLVPGLLTAKRIGARNRGRIVVRSIAVAVAAVVVAGGGAWLLCRLVTTPAVSHGTALLIKIVFGASLAAAVTPPALRHVLRGMTVQPGRATP